MPAHWWKGNLPFQSQVPPKSYSEDQTLCYKCLLSTKEWTHMQALPTETSKGSCIHVFPLNLLLEIPMQ